MTVRAWVKRREEKEGCGSMTDRVGLMPIRAAALLAADRLENERRAALKRAKLGAPPASHY